MKKLTLRLSIVFLFISTLTLTAQARSKNAQSSAEAPAEISVMTFNVENLFDTEHDKGTDDYTYLPLSVKKKNKEVQKACEKMGGGFYQKQCFELDWNKKVLNTKLEHVAQVILSQHEGKGADNILMAEVENLRVLKMLTNQHLKKAGYKTVVLIEGPDTRGIDPAFISKFPQVGKAHLHIIPYKDEDPKKLEKAKRSRGILEVSVQIPNGKAITFLAAHFPSQSNPTEWRAQAVNFAKDLMLKYQSEGRTVIFGGDLNVIASEEAKRNYFKNELSQAGDISHFVGCKSCLGTHNYKGDWSFLDVLVFSKNLKESGYALDPESIQVVKTPLNTNEDGTPLRFDEEKFIGVSDHLPLFAKLKLIKPQPK